MPVSVCTWAIPEAIYGQYIHGIMTRLDNRSCCIWPGVISLISLCAWPMTIAGSSTYSSSGGYMWQYGHGQRKFLLYNLFTETSMHPGGGGGELVDQVNIICNIVVDLPTRLKF